MGTESYLDDVLSQLNNRGFLFSGYHLSYVDKKPIILGQGGSSRIYQMEQDSNEERKYALKVIFMDAAPSRDFKAEINLQSQVSAASDNVVSIIAAVEYRIILDYEGNIEKVLLNDAESNNAHIHLQMILMEKLEPIMYINKFHKAAIRREELTTEEGVIKMAGDISKALMVAHSIGILHRDVKLENIFWDEKNMCYKLGDFGIATVQITNRTMTRLGSAGYVAPEVLNTMNKAYYNEMADIYSFGMCLYVLLNELRFPGSNGYHPSGRQYENDFILPAPVNASEQMACIIRTLCAFDLNDRYPSMEAVMVEINGLKHHEEMITDVDVEHNDNEETVCIDEETICKDNSNIKNLREQPNIQSNALQNENSKRLLLIEEKHRNKIDYRKKEILYVALMMPLFVVLLAEVARITWDGYAHHNYEGIMVAIYVCILSLTPSVMIAVVPGALLAIPLEYTFTHYVPKAVYFFIVTILIILIQRLMNYRIKFKQGNIILLFYYRLFRYLLPLILMVILFRSPEYYGARKSILHRDYVEYFFRLCGMLTMIVCLIRDLYKWIRAGQKKK
ncbi:serine/threonine protein kinase [Butyrivibrio sp. YAB3001]|uniref:serine/threonine protein kinase n=1 Tax=Butyrivibrio sp. YAB3001 TaxID=1520812 RepID=UPI0008F683C6|nr:protein kinase [Butyrivibrio sp. YAB3001]SFB81505.1 Serine/threonine protein kinase [Butyrivibrio sp. YAB3001]